MTDVELFSTLRYVNLGLCLVVIVSTTVTLRRIWRMVPAEVRLSRSSLIGLAFAGLYGTAEQLLLGIPGGPRTVVTFCALSLAALSCCLPRRYRMFPRPRRDTPQEETP